MAKTFEFESFSV